MAVVVGGDDYAGGIEFLDDPRKSTSSLATQITKSTKDMYLELRNESYVFYVSSVANSLQSLFLCGFAA